MLNIPDSGCSVPAVFYPCATLDGKPVLRILQADQLQV